MRVPLHLREDTGLKPASPEAFKLLMDGSIAMSRMERVGLRVDVPYLDRAIQETQKKIDELNKNILNSTEYRAWEREYGNRMRPGSRSQLGHIMFGVMKYKRNPFMGQRNNVAAFEHLKSDFVRAYQDIERLKKALSTSLIGIRREVVDGRLHPFIDLHTAESYRSSSQSPNMHNQPVRNEDISRIVRTSIIPDKDCELLEADFNSHEVRTSYMYHKDPQLKNYLLGGGDMHTDKCKALYMLSDKELGSVDEKPGKLIRYAAKNLFVFRQFYGGVYFQAAPELWDFISLYHLTTAQGVPLHEHLASKGIKKLGACNPEKEIKKGTYEAHVREVEREMWEETFPVYAQWKKDWWEKYQRQGGINTLSGFRMFGNFRRNQILCDPIQGSAFHILLWCLIEEGREIIKRKMKSRLLLQIHDSQLWNVHRKEKDDVIELIQDVCLKRVQKHFPWINIPLRLEFECSETSWFDKKKIKVAA